MKNVITTPVHKNGAKTSKDNYGPVSILSKTLKYMKELYISAQQLSTASHDLLLAKLNTYGFSLPALRLVQSYLSNRKQRT